MSRRSICRILGGGEMWIIREENHGALCVTEDIPRGIAWLVKNDWLHGGCEAVNLFEEIHTLEEQIGTSDEKEIIAWFVKLLANRGIETTLEILEEYGFCFSDIEVA
jgi:hypothetical protein